MKEQNRVNIKMSHKINDLKAYKFGLYSKSIINIYLAIITVLEWNSYWSRRILCVGES